jgi:hypothetical protein
MVGRLRRTANALPIRIRFCTVRLTSGPYRLFAGMCCSDWSVRLSMVPRCLIPVLLRSLELSSYEQQPRCEIVNSPLKSLTRKRLNCCNCSRMKRIGAS